VPVDSGTVTISRSPSISTAAGLICIRLGLPTGKSDEPKIKAGIENQQAKNFVRVIL